MDPSLKALCGEVLFGDVNSERFALLIIEAGVNLDGLEWDVANRLLEVRENQNALAKQCSETLQ